MTATQTLDPADASLLNLLQRELPLVPRPFEELSRRLGCAEAQVLDRVAELKRGRGVIRQISAIFDSRVLGYESSLVAAQVEESQLDAAAEVIGAHPGVSHSYRREHAYNLWYTIAVPPDSRLGLERTVQILHERSGARITRLMPALKMYKIGVKFDLGGAGQAATRETPAAEGEVRGHPVSVNESDQQMIRVLQQDLPVVARPFDELAEQAGVGVDELLAAGHRYLESGMMRRFSAVLRHREAGFTANAMGAWIVPPERRDEFGTTAASFAAVTHCYLRPTYEDWPYSLFTMVHGTSPEECESVLRAIARATGIDDFAALYSTREYKKSRVRYFTPEVHTWELDHSARQTAGV